MVYQFIQILNSQILIDIFVTMGPIAKKINQILSTEEISDETTQILKKLMDEIQPIERRIINDSYHNGYTDKEMGRKAIWGHYEDKYANTFWKSNFNNSK